MNRFSALSIASHLFLLSALILFTEPKHEPIRKREPLLVERVLLQKEQPAPVSTIAPPREPEPEIAIVEPAPEIEPPAKEEPSPSPPPPVPPKKVEKKIEKKRAPAPKPVKPKKASTPPPSKANPKKEAPKTDPKRDLALQKARDALKKSTQTIEDAAPLKKESAKQIAQLSSESISKQTKNVSVGEVSYREELTRRLQLKIVLPESGFVEIKLTISRQGQFKKVEIVKGSKLQNRQAVEKIVPTLTFPPFGSHFPGEESHTFLIMLTSD